MNRHLLLLRAAGLVLLACALHIQARAQPAGSLDESFGTGGKKVISLTTGDDKAYSTAMQPDGKILVGGYSSSTGTGKNFTCLRLKTDGSLDSTFGLNGKAIYDLQSGSDDVAYALALQTDGKIVLAGYSDDGTYKDAALMRLKPNGTRDSSFGVNGQVITDFDSMRADEIKVVKVHEATGNIVVGGSAQINTNKAKPVVARYLPTGVLDNSFDGDGIRIAWATSLEYQYLLSIEDLAVQSNGKITAVGWRDFPALQWDSDYRACRINSNGTMDNTFSSDGVETYNGSFNGSDRAYAMVLNSDNSFWMAGGRHVSTIYYDFDAFKITGSGSVGTGLSTVDFGALADDIAYAMMIDADGNIVLAGTTTSGTSSSFALSRASVANVDDVTFGTNGLVTTTFGSNMVNACYDAVLQDDGKIVAVGFSGSDIAIARYLGSAQPMLNSFTLQAPVNNANNVINPTATLNWTDAYGATKYQMMIDSSADFSDNPLIYLTTNSTKTLINLQPNTTYWWKVRAIATTDTGAWSVVWKFKTSATPTAIAGIAAQGWNIYPNPVQAELTIESPDLQAEVPYRVLELTGRLLLTGAVSAGHNRISLVPLPAGTYLLMLGDQLPQAIRIQKQ